jgi:hypothetical protein
VGEVARFDVSCISGDGQFSEGRTIRPDLADATLLGVNSGQHCRRVRAKREWRIPPVPADLNRFGKRVEYHLLLARDLHFLADAVFARLTSEVQEVKKMLAGLIRRVDAERLRQ